MEPRTHLASQARQHHVYLRQLCWGRDLLVYPRHGHCRQSPCTDTTFGPFLLTTAFTYSQLVCTQEFGGRAAQIKSFVSQTTDGNGHGTHIAGIIGGTVHGVAKRTRLYGVKVLDDNGSGTLAHVIGGMDFIAQDAKRRGSGGDCPRGAMANLSIGGAYSRAVNDAAAALVRAGVFVAMAAGGNNGDAGRTSPASEPTVCTVGASTAQDARAPFSDYGSVVDVFAPGVNIKAAWPSGNTVRLREERERMNLRCDGVMVVLVSCILTTSSKHCPARPWRRRTLQVSGRILPGWRDFRAQRHCASGFRSWRPRMS